MQPLFGFGTKLTTAAESTATVGVEFATDRATPTAVDVSANPLAEGSAAVGDI